MAQISNLCGDLILSGRTVCNGVRCLRTVPGLALQPGARIQLDDFNLNSMTRNKARSIAKAIELTLLQNLKFNEGEQND